MEILLRNLDSLTLRLLSQGGNPQACVAFYNSFGMQTAQYILANYSIDLRDSLNDTPEAMVVLGLFYYGKENGIGEITSDEEGGQNYVPNDQFNCFMAAVGSLLAAGEVISIYNDFKRGVSARTIIRLLKAGLKKVATAWTVVTAIYSLGDCLDWW